MHPLIKSAATWFIQVQLYNKYRRCDTIWKLLVVSNTATLIMCLSWADTEYTNETHFNTNVILVTTNI